MSPLLAGCFLVGPDFVEPAVSLDPQWSSGQERQPPGSIVADAAWWRSFGDPQLDDLIDRAVRQNLTLQSAGVRVLQARAVLAATVGEYYPQQQQAFAALLAERGLDDSGGIIGSGTRSYNLGRAGITASWEIDFWGRFRRAIEAADSGLVASIADYDSAMVSLLADIATTYVNLRALEALVVVTRRNVGLQRQSLGIAQARFREGETSERDPAQAEGQLRETEAKIPSYEAQIEQARNALAVLLGITPAEIRSLLPPAPVPRPPLMVAAGVPADLLRRRPDLRAALATASAQSAQVGVQRAQLFPALSLSGSFGVLGTDVGGAQVAASRGWNWTTSYSVGPAIFWNIFNWGQITNQVRAQDAVLQQAVLGYQQAVLNAQREVEDGMSEFAAAQRSAASLRQAVNAARVAARVARAQYQQGQTDFTTVVTAERSLLSYEGQLVQAEAAIPSSLAAVYRALGGGWQIREGLPLVSAANRREMELRTDWGPLLDYDDGRLTPPPVRGILPRPSF